MNRSVHSAVVTSNLAALRDYMLRHDRMAQLPQVIQAIELAPPDASGRICLEANTRNIHRIARILDDPCLGLEMMAHVPVNSLALLDSIKAQLGPGRERLRQHPIMVVRLLERYLRLYSEVVELECHVSKTHYRVVLRPYSDQVSHHQTDGALVVVKRALDALTEERLCSVSVTHAGLGDAARRYREYLGVAPDFGARRIEMVFTNTARTAASVGDYLMTVAVNERRLHAQFPSLPFAERCRGVIRLLLALGEPRREHLCQIFSMSLATLKRRLQAEGCSYATLVREVRQSLALQYAADDGLSVTETALLLGYQDIHQYSRAFKDWFGHAPSRHAGTEAT